MRARGPPLRRHRCGGGGSSNADGCVRSCGDCSTWRSGRGQVGAAVEAAIRAGYRHIDCASNYLNEDEVGDTLTRLIADGVVRREELFITGKLNNPYHHRADVRPHLEKTLKDLNLAYLDLYLMHWPVAFAYVPYDPNRRGYDADYDPDGCTKIDLTPYGGTKIDSTVSIRETWEAMEQLVDAGLVKAIGVSNFTAPLIHDLLTYARIKPAVNQVELHPFLQQPALVAYCQRLGICVSGYSPLGTNDFRKPHEPSVLADPHIAQIAAAHGKSPAQVALRWATQRNVVVLPKSVHPARIAENIAIFDFQLTPAEMGTMKTLDRNYHYLRPNDWYGIPLFEP